MEFSNRKPAAEEYNNLRASSGMGELKKIEAVEVALANSLYMVSVYEGKKLIGFGRVVGDKGITFAITDVMVSKEHQRKGIGDEIMERIDTWLDENTDERSFVMLFANRPADKLYERHRFQPLDAAERIGMKRK